MDTGPRRKVCRGKETLQRSGKDKDRQRLQNLMSFEFRKLRFLWPKDEASLLLGVPRRQTATNSLLVAVETQDAVVKI